MRAILALLVALTMFFAAEAMPVDHPENTPVSTISPCMQEQIKRAGARAHGALRKRLVAAGRGPRRENEPMFGVDYASYVPVKAVECMMAAGYEFAIPRAFRSTGIIDANYVVNVDNAWQAGMNWVDVYFFPAIKNASTTPEEQMATLVADVKSHNVEFLMLWLDVEMEELWTGDFELNREMAQRYINAAFKANFIVGIYASKHYWPRIFGDEEWVLAPELPLWYPRYDNKANFTDFKPFGGWTKPTIKQFTPTTPVCGISVDLNVYFPSA